MIHAILKKGKIQPLDELPEHWREGQELIVEGCEPSHDPAEIKKCHAEPVALSAQIPADDHEQIAAAVAAQDRDAKARQINEEARRNPQSAYANKFVGIANGHVVVTADNLDEMVRRLRQVEPDPSQTFGVETSRDYDEVHEIWRLC